MSWKNQIHQNLKPLDMNESISDALLVAEDYRLSHVPVQKEGVYLGCIAVTDLETLEETQTLQQYQYLLQGIFTRETSSWMDVLELFSRNESNICPLLGNDQSYLGHYLLEDVQEYFLQTTFIKEPGTILIVQKNLSDFSMSQIAQIVESNQAKLLGCMVEEMESDQVRVMVKISLGAINEIIQSFRRYHYEIVSEHHEDLYLQNLKERSDYLDKYLSI
ncbi:MAG: acetoin utilization protein acuB [Flavobacterium sp.]